MPTDSLCLPLQLSALCIYKLALKCLPLYEGAVYATGMCTYVRSENETSKSSLICTSTLAKPYNPIISQLRE